MLPFEFRVIGTPLSQQTKDKKKLRKWKDTVRAEAKKRWPDGELPMNQPIQAKVVYYYEGDATLLEKYLRTLRQNAHHGLEHLARGSQSQSG